MHQSSPQPLTAHEETRSAWNTNAAFWDERMGEGNDFVNVLIWPAVQRLLDIQPGARVLDIACGNGLTARRLADLGATVVASDFAETMIDHARQRSAGYSARITYQVLDDELRSMPSFTVPSRERPTVALARSIRVLRTAISRKASPMSLRSP